MLTVLSWSSWVIRTTCSQLHFIWGYSFKRSCVTAPAQWVNDALYTAVALLWHWDASVLKQEVVLQFAAGLSGWWFTEVPYNHTPCYGLNQNSLANFLLCAGQFGVWLHCLYFPFWANTKRLFVSKRSVPTQWSCGALRLWLHSKLEHAQYCDNPRNEGFPLHVAVDLFSVGVHKQEQTVKTSDNVKLEFGIQVRVWTLCRQIRKCFDDGSCHSLSVGPILLLHILCCWTGGAFDWRAAIWDISQPVSHLSSPCHFNTNHLPPR